MSVSAEQVGSSSGRWYQLQDVPVHPWPQTRDLEEPPPGSGATWDGGTSTAPRLRSAVSGAGFDHLSPPMARVEDPLPVTPQDPVVVDKDPFSVKSPFAGADRAAVVVFGPGPSWSPLTGRRPVVAMVDSGIGAHPWLDRGDGAPVWIDARDEGWSGPGTSPAAPRDGDVRPADGALDVFAGHGTFVAGLVHQKAPEALLLSLQVMDSAGFFAEGAVENALAWLLDRVRRSAADASLFVDVVCLAFGYYVDDPMADPHTTALRALLGELGELGVLVVVAAGNDFTEAPTYPAAFTALSTSPTSSTPLVPLISVGATNPDGSHAEYSNHGRWVETWDTGTALVSTVPVQFGVPSADPRAAGRYDPDNLVGGFARWAGTSFAAAVHAGRLASALATEDLTGVSAGQAAARASRARETLARESRRAASG